MEEKIKFAVVGSGHIGMRHAEMIKRNDEAMLVAMCDLDVGKEDAVRELGVQFYTSIEELLNNETEVDVLSICTPNGLHAQHALMSLEKKKHIVCEKPMALTKSDCEKIIFKALQVHKNVFCVMQNRYSAPSAWLKEIVEQGIMGEIFMVQLVCYWNRDDRYYKKGNWKGTLDLDGGTLFTQFSHFIDIMYWVFGDISDINANFEDFNHGHSTSFEDSGVVSFKFVNGGMGSLNYSTSIYDKNMESSITVIGSNGSIKIGGQYMNKVEYCHIKDYEMPDLPEAGVANDYGSYKGSAANHHFIIENVIDTIKERTSITTNALEGLKVVDIIERIYSTRNIKK